jgi:hypothetical protein
MKLRSPKALALTAAGILAAATLGWAQIERLDLNQMVTKTDNAIVGKIVDARVIRTDGQVQELYFTTLTIQGTSLVNNQQLTVDVTYPGGFISPTEGVFNSEAPAADDVKLGNRVVAFYKWSDNMGNGLAANALYASHGGLYRVASARGEAVVLGRGDGYALSRNWRLSDLGTAIAQLKNK